MLGSLVLVALLLALVLAGPWSPLARGWGHWPVTAAAAALAVWVGLIWFARERTSMAATALRRWTAEERAARIELAACYRLIAQFRMTDLVYTHISARIPGTEHFLLNPYGFLFEEVSTSNLVRIDVDGRIVEDTPYQVNPAGFTIHSAIHRAQPDVQCVLHTHTRAGIAV